MVLEKYLLTFDLTKFSIIKIPFWMDNYKYNPWFLPTWMEKNHIKKAHLLRVLGLIGKANLDIWLGQSKKQREDAAKGIKIVPPPIPLHHIATICNHYHIDIRNFFVMPGTDFADENGRDIDETPDRGGTAGGKTAGDAAATVPATTPDGSPSGLSTDSMLRIIDNLQQENQKLVNELVRLSEAHRDEISDLNQILRRAKAKTEASKVSLHPQKEQPSIDTDEDTAVAWIAADDYPNDPERD
jgi:hypothetical protein